MQNCKLIENGTLKITPSQESSQSDFDFYAGHWNIRNKRLKDRLCNSDEWVEFDAKQEMQIILRGYGNTDNFIAEFDGKPFEGRTIRLYDPKTRLWSMYWTDNFNPILQPPTVGSFEGYVLAVSTQPLMLSDIQIIQKTLAGDQQAYSSLVSKYQNYMYTVCLNILKNKPDAEEATQDTFIKAYKKLATYKDESKFSSWLYKIAYRNCLDMLRKRKNTTDIDEVAYGLADSGNVSGELEQ